MVETVVEFSNNIHLQRHIDASPYLLDIMEYVQAHADVDPAHDWLHIQRVMGSGLTIAKAEGANERLVLIAALLHDIKNLPKSHPASHLSSQFSADFAKRYLQIFPLEAKEIAIIADAILNHSYSRGQKPKTLEGQVLQDADRLDSLGAIGIARCFVVGGCHQRTMYHPTDASFKEERDLDDKKYTVDHFYRKLFKLPDLMQTAKGTALAVERVSRMKMYLQWMEEEIG